MGGDHVGRDAGAVDATDTEHPLHALFRRRQAAPVGKEVLAHTGHRAQGEVDGDPRMDQSRAGGGQGGVDEHQAGDRLGLGHCLQRGHQATHRVADQNGRRAGHRLEEPAQQAAVPFDVGGPSLGRGQPVPHQVEGQQARPLGQAGGDRQPVDVGATQAVHGDHERTAGRPSHVHVVHRAVDVDGEGLEAGTRE